MNTIYTIVSDSFKQTSKHKILWVFALLTVLSSVNSPNRNLPKDSPVIRSSVLGLISPERTLEYSSSNVNVVAISPPTENFKLADSLAAGLIHTKTNSLSIKRYVQTLIEESLYYLIVLGIFALVFITFVVLTFFFTASWATGALFSGVKKVIENKPYTLHSLASLGRRYIKEVFKFYILQFSAYLLLMIVFSISFHLLKDNFTGYLSVTFPLFILFLLAFLIGTFAYRYIVNDNNNFKVALRKSTRLVFKYPIKAATFLLIYMGIFLIASTFLYSINILNSISLDMSIILYIPSVLLMTTVAAYLTTFQAFYFTHCFNFLTKGEKLQ